MGGGGTTPSGGLAENPEPAIIYDISEIMLVFNHHMLVYFLALWAWDVVPRGEIAEQVRTWAEPDQVSHTEW